MQDRKKINEIRKRRAKRTRAKIFGTTQKPRLSIFRSNRFLFAQLIDDAVGKTVTEISTRKITNQKMSKMKQAELAGELLAKKAINSKIKTVVFDRGSYKYHGRVKSFAEGAKKAGLKI